MLHDLLCGVLCSAVLCGVVREVADRILGLRQHISKEQHCMIGCLVCCGVLWCAVLWCVW